MKIWSIYFFALLIFTACEHSTFNSSVIIKEHINGNVQKGPYNNGATVTISELRNDLSPTGKNYTTEVIDNLGSFELKNIELVSPYVELRANGFYYNEITGENSSAQLTLTAVTDLTDLTNININLLTTIEKSRVLFLIENGMDFSSAKSQAEKELLQLFNIDETIAVPEELDISKEGNENAILLAISSILQGRRTPSDLSELIANISLDLREDGSLDNPELQSSLINHAMSLHASRIRENLVSKYSGLNGSFRIADFEKYIKQFQDSSKFVYNGLVAYPESGKYGKNLLAYEGTDTIQIKSGSYSLRAIPHDPGKTMVLLHFFNFDNSYSNWFIDASDSGWNAEWISTGTNTLRFYDNQLKTDLDCHITLNNSLSATVSIYEYDLEIPARIINISW